MIRNTGTFPHANLTEGNANFDGNQVQSIYRKNTNNQFNFGYDDFTIG